MGAGKRLTLTHLPKLTYDELCEKIGFNEPVTVYFDGLSRRGRLHEKYMLDFDGCTFVWEGGLRYRVVAWPIKNGKEVKA